MPITLTPGEVEGFTKAVVSQNVIDAAASVIEDETGYTPDEHNTARSISENMVKMAWSIVATRLDARLESAGGENAIISETQGDYSYSTSVTLSMLDRFGELVAGDPRRLLDLDVATWSHI